MKRDKRKDKFIKDRIVNLATGVLVLVGVFYGVAVHGGVNPDWDWKGEKRKLKVWVNVPADKKLGDTKVSDAVANAKTEINGAGSKWELADGTKDDHDIEIKIADINEDVGGAQNEYTKMDGARTVVKRTVVIDETPKGGETWGSDGKKFDPYTVILHELLHKLRIKHQGSTTDKSNNIADPSLPGTHKKNLSNDDKDDLKASGGIAGKAGNGAPVQKSQKNACCAVDESFSFEGSSVLFPQGTFLQPVDIGFSLTRDEETVTDPFDIPGFEDYRMFRGVLLDITPGLSTASGIVDFSLAYMDSGFADIDDPEFRPIRESSIQPFIYNTSAGVWMPLSTINPMLDTAGNMMDFGLHVSELLSPSNMGYDPSMPESVFSFVALGGLEVPEPSSVILVAMLTGCAAWRSKRFRRERTTCKPPPR